MSQRLNAFQVAPEAYKAMLVLQDYVNKSALEHSLMELVKIRASQINRCAYCLHMHVLDARKAGESEARINLLNAWEESELYTPRERAALREPEEAHGTRGDAVEPVDDGTGCLIHCVRCRFAGRARLT